ncbi:MAG: LysR substrate-binding domain-containing protein [Sciscionella sp.]
MIPSAGVGLLPRTLAALARARPDLEVTSRVSTTPSLARSLRAGTLDLAVLTSRPPHRPVDGESPVLAVVPLAEHRLQVAVPADGPLGARSAVDLADLVDGSWIATPSRSDEPQLGAWPSLPGRPRLAHAAGGWATKLQLVAAGCGITTVSPLIAPAAPAGIRIVPVRDGPAEIRRVSAAHLPGRCDQAAEAVIEALSAEARALGQGADSVEG